jgi:hypothetical protein
MPFTTFGSDRELPVTKDFADFLASLNSEDAVYVVIGGIAVLSYVPYRTTRDLDVLIEPTLENARRARRAVKSWLGSDPQFAAEEFIAGDILSFGGLLRVEVHSNVPGPPWAEIWKGRVAGEFAGVPTHFAGPDELIAMKEATGGAEKDLPDLIRLREMKRKS